jgi:hypothetical protein
MTYYTLRKVGDLDKPTFALAKWEWGETQPTDVYKQWVPYSRASGYAVHSCNCPSRSNPCKHAEMSESLLNENSVYELPVLYWEDGKVHISADIPRHAF